MRSRTSAPKRNTSSEPRTENYPKLKEWLEKHDARCQWQQRVGGDDGNMMLEGYVIPGKPPFVVQIWSNGNGYHILTDSHKVKLNEYFEDTERRLSGAP